MSPTPDQIDLLLSHTPPFHSLRPEQQAKVLDVLSLAYYEADERILNQGGTDHDYLYLVVSGHVQVRDAATRQL